MPADDWSRRSAQPDGPIASRLSLQVAICDGVRTLRLRGELDLACRAALEDAIMRLVANGCTVVVDLRGLTFMDTSGVHVALAANALCAAHGCELRLIPGPAAVQRVFDLAGTLAGLSFLDEDGHVATELLPSNSEHGAVLDPVLDRLAARVGRPRRKPPHPPQAQWAPMRRFSPKQHGL
ncbi:MAG TPA: STAS domain-containing protein [Solirubrobacteraceae bacterium]|jgi:anti-sigma B factor antagonist|nr:STAS domain-containing protein [Solirubrobacteraceae bacterium]